VYTKRAVRIILTRNSTKNSLASLGIRLNSINCWMFMAKCCVYHLLSKRVYEEAYGYFYYAMELHEAWTGDCFSQKKGLLKILM
jgi:hypothetical protein